VQISALRRILDRDRAQGSCIQTIPGRGYRFIAPVTWGDAVTATPISRAGNGSATTIASNGQAEPLSTQCTTDALSPALTPGAPDRLRRALIAGVTAALCLVAAVVAAVNRGSLSPWEGRSAPRLSIVVLPFTNLGNDLDQQYFADALTEDLTTDVS